ncbi:MAG: zf-TFIIB domain-containing protein [Planctomycetota bacterium]
MRALRFHDDRGNETKLYPLGRVIALGMDRDRFSTPARESFGRAVARAAVGIESLPLIISLGFVLALAGVFWRFGGRPFGLVFHTPAIVAGIAMAILLGKLWGVAILSYRRRIIAVMLAHKHCPSCGHGLAGCELEGGEHSRCSECGAIWNTDRIGREVGAPSHPKVIASDLLERHPR